MTTFVMLGRGLQFGPKHVLKCFRANYATPSKGAQSLRGGTKIKDRLSSITKSPVIETTGNFGTTFLAGGSLVGLGALCYYGLRETRGDSVLDRASMGWSPIVRDRIHATYMYFGSSVALTAASALAAFRSPAIMKIAGRGTWPVAIGGMIATIAANMLTMSLPYPESGLGAKHLAWGAQNLLVGAILAPVCFVGGPILTRAAMYTAGIIGGLSAIAVTAPSEKFLNMGGALGIGLGVVFVSSIGSMFASPVTALGAGLYSISLYGGLVLFSGFLLYDTQKVVQKAEMHPIGGSYNGQEIRPFDPINSSIGIYYDTMNIFIRLVAILSGGNRRK